MSKKVVAEKPYKRKGERVPVKRVVKSPVKPGAIKSSVIKKVIQTVKG